MKVLLLGYSSIARRRVLPALRTSGIESVDIASVSAETVEWSGAGQPRLFRNYEAALKETDADAVYISTVNNLHAEMAERALERGLHVAIDKPAFLSLEEAQRALDIATRNDRCIAEATVYSYHPRIATALQVFKEAQVDPTNIVAVFSFPPHPSHNFRYRAELGGGAMLDLGPYAITPGRVFFGEASSEIISRYLSSRNRVDTSFSLMATYSMGRSIVGSFGYTTGYLNRLDLLGPGITVSMDRAFSPLADVTTELIVRREDQMATITIPPADTFALFFSDFFLAIAQRDYSRLAAAYPSDQPRLVSRSGPAGRSEMSQVGEIAPGHAR
jgi:predicted dehydrogenase